MTGAVSLIGKMRGLVAVARTPNILQSRPVKFIAIGIVNTAFGYFIFAALYLIIVDYRLSIVVAMIIGLIFNFHHRSDRFPEHEQLADFPLRRRVCSFARRQSRAA
jgi:GtrA-like protein